MSKFKVGDRVQAPGKKVGTVRYVGKVTFAKGNNWCGVEFDKPVGDCDGKGKKDGKQYFKCKPKHGMIQKHSYFTEAKEPARKKGAKDKKEKLSAKPTKKRPSVAPKSSKASKKSGKSKGATMRPVPDLLAARPVPDLLGPPAKAPNFSMGVQTDIAEEAYSGKQLAQYVVHLEREKVDKVEKEKDELRQQLREATSDLYQKQSEIQKLGYETKLAEARNEEATRKGEELELEVEGLKIQLEMARLDIEERDEKIEDGIQTYLLSIQDIDGQKAAELSATNAQLTEALRQLKQSTEAIVDSKNREIGLLQTELAYIPAMEQRIKELLSVERELEQLKWDMKGFDKVKDSVEESEKVLSDFKNYNMSIEGELSDWREYVIDVDDERQLLEQLNDENEVFIEELSKNNKELRQKLTETSKKLKQTEATAADYQKELFELRNELQQMNSQQEFGMDMTVNVTGGVEDGDDEAEQQQKAQNESSGDSKGQTVPQARVDGLMNQNRLLSKRLQLARGMLAAKVSNAVAGADQKVRYELLRAYFPSTLSIDDTGVSVICNIERCMQKAEHARDLFEHFFADPLSGASFGNADICLQSHYLCPLVLRVETGLRAIQRGFLVCGKEKWSNLVSQYGSKFMETKGNVETELDGLLKAIEMNTIQDFSDDNINAVEVKLKAFIKSNCVEFDPDCVRKDDTRVEKSVVMRAISETYYRILTLTLKLNQFNGKMHEIVHAPVQTTAALKPGAMIIPTTPPIETADAPVPDTDDSKTAPEDAGFPSAAPDVASVAPPSQGVDINNTVDFALTKLKVGVMEKMLRLRNSMLSTCQSILRKTHPIDVGYAPRKLTCIAQLSNANRTSATQGQLNSCRSTVREALERVKGLCKAIEKVDGYKLPLERVEAINDILGKEEENFEEGLLTKLDSAYVLLRSVDKLTDASGSQHRTTNDLPVMTSAEKENVTAPVWELKAAEIRDAIDEAGVLREKAQEIEKIMAGQKQVMFDLNKTIVEKNAIISALEKKHNIESSEKEQLVELQTKIKELNIRNAKYVEGMQAKTTEARDLRNKADELSAQIEKYKKAMAAGNQSRGGGGRGRKNSVSDIDVPSLPSRAKTGTMSVGGTSVTRTRSQSPGGARTVLKHIDPNVASIMQQAMPGRSSDDSDFGYTDLLHQTIQSLRRQLNVLSCRSDAKTHNGNIDSVAALPSLRHTIGTTDEKTQTQATDEESSDVILSADGESEMKKMLGRLLQIRAQPKMVDVTSSQKAFIGGQEMVGRQFELRDIQIRCQRLRQSIQKESNEKEPLNRLSMLGPAIGQCSLPCSVSSSHNVVIPSQQLQQLHDAVTGGL